jgi:putative redox protein
MTNIRREASLRWTGEGLVFDARAPGARPFRIEEGPSPMEALLAALAGCMAVDVLVILEKSRVEVSELEVDIEGDRAPDPPQRFMRIRIVFRLAGPGEEDEGRIHRAIELSRDKYCSVHHSLRPDLEIETVFELV